MLYRNEKLNKQGLVDLTEAKQNAFMELKGEYSSPIIETYRYLLELCVHSAKNDAQALFDTALRAATYFEQLPIKGGITNPANNGCNLLIINSYENANVANDGELPKGERKETPKRAEK